MNENNNKSNTLLLTVIAVATLLVAVIGATFAYFTANITGTESASTVEVEAATLEITFADGTSTLVVRGEGNDVVQPTAAAWINKTFTITGKNTTTNMYMPYTLNLVVDQNTFVLDNLITGKSISCRLTHDVADNQTGMIPNLAANEYLPIKTTLTTYTVGQNTVNIDANDQLGTINVDSAAQAVTGVNLGRGYFAPTGNSTVAHRYTLEVYFMEDGTNQDIDKTKVFQGYIDVTTSTANEAIVSTQPTATKASGTFIRNNSNS